MPLSIVFSEYYYYLIAYDDNDKSFTPKRLYLSYNEVKSKAPC